MKHRVAGRHLKRTTGARQALFKNLVRELIRHEKISTTEAKARAIRGQAEKMISLAKRGDVHSRRLALRTVGDPQLLAKLFDDIGPRYMDRAGGYTRMFKIGQRKGDAAQMVVLELV